MYAITATLSWMNPDGFNAVRQIPIFYLNENVQGIVSVKHAVTIAQEILNPLSDPSLTFSISAVKV